MMRAFRLFRAGRSRRAAEAAAAETLEGLDAFASELPAPADADGAADRPRRRPWLVPFILAALVLVQAGPTVLWVRGLLAGASRPLAAAPPTATGSAPPTATSDGRPADGLLPTTGVAEPDQPVPSAPPPAPRPERRRPAPQPPAPPALLAGLLSVDAPVPMQVLQRGRVIGTTEADTIMLPVGTHDLELANEAVGYSLRRTVAVESGRTANLQVPAPSGTLHVNALPWADVWIDGQHAGETPLGNLQAPIGTRDVVFRHPDLGERRMTVLVTLKAPARVSVDLRQP